ncbi:MAG: hypothetical protein K9L85_02445 [Candidatus Peribacteraceae bacterium]|nr:hypothetical protein [Candidatus Peribacteraceae bacterium]
MSDENKQDPKPSAGDNGATPPPPPPPPPKDDGAKPKMASPLQSDEELSEDQFITGGDDHSFITGVPIPAHPNTQFDEKKFLELLSKSISLTKTEKQRIITSIPKLSQYQIDELIRIFEEEQKKFSELNKKHEDQLKAIEAKHKNDWNDIEMQAKQDDKKKKDDDEAAALRKKMGLE